MHRRTLIISCTILIALLGGTLFFVLNQKDQPMEFERPDENPLDFPLPGEGVSMPSSASPETEAEADTPYIDLPPDACTTECTAYPIGSDEGNYCRTVCGLSLQGEGEPSAISVDTPYAESVRQRDEAVRESDLDKCSAIKDSALRKSCEVRVTEDLLE